MKPGGRLSPNAADQVYHEQGKKEGRLGERMGTRQGDERKER